MTLRGVLSSLALTGAAFALQGCVVAAAAPFAAAGVAIAKGKRDAPRRLSAFDRRRAPFVG